jgi:2'-5' RNA ligase
LAAFTAFDVELTEITRFPVTDVLYIALGRGHEDAYRAHSALNRGIFAYQEPFEYRPHVTLMVPRAGADIDGSQQASARKWAEFKGSKRFPVDRLDFLRQDAAGGWERVREIYLARQNAQKTG